MRVWVICGLLAVLAQLSGASPVRAEAGVAEAIVGDWQWVYRPGMPIMQPDEVVQYRIRRNAEGELLGNGFDGERRVPHLDIVRVEIDGRRVRFVHPAANHYYEGELSDDGQQIIGFERHHGQIDDLELRRQPRRF